MASVDHYGITAGHLEVGWRNKTNGILMQDVMSLMTYYQLLQDTTLPLG